MKCWVLSAGCDYTSNRSAERKVTSGSKGRGNRRGGLTKSKDAQQRFLDHMSFLTGAFPFLYLESWFN